MSKLCVLSVIKRTLLTTVSARAEAVVQKDVIERVLCTLQADPGQAGNGGRAAALGALQVGRAKAALHRAIDVSIRLSVNGTVARCFLPDSYHLVSDSCFAARRLLLLSS